MITMITFRGCGFLRLRPRAVRHRADIRGRARRGAARGTIDPGDICHPQRRQKRGVDSPAARCGSGRRGAFSARCRRSSTLLPALAARIPDLLTWPRKGFETDPLLRLVDSIRVVAGRTRDPDSSLRWDVRGLDSIASLTSAWTRDAVRLANAGARRSAWCDRRSRTARELDEPRTRSRSRCHIDSERWPVVAPVAAALGFAPTARAFTAAVRTAVHGRRLDGDRAGEDRAQVVRSRARAGRAASALPWHAA